MVVFFHHYFMVAANLKVNKWPNNAPNQKTKNRCIVAGRRLFQPVILVSISFRPSIRYIRYLKLEQTWHCQCEECHLSWAVL